MILLMINTDLHVSKFVYIDIYIYVRADIQQLFLVGHILKHQKIATDIHI